VKQLGARRVMVVTDPHLAERAPVQIALEALRHEGLEAVLYDRVSIEPTDASFRDAIQFATEGQFDGYVAVGGGSTIDTAKAANLYATCPADLLAYVNPPIGQGRPVPGALKPLIAIPTTAGTGSEATGTAIFDLREMHVKTGIAHRALRPTLGIVDPDNTRTLPRMVAACTGFDVLCHAIESLTAIAYDKRPAPENPSLRPPYQGANPISDTWAERAIQMVTANLVRAVEDPAADAARGADDPRRDVCGNRLRKCGRASAARDVVSDRRDGERVHPRRLPVGSPDRAARHGRRAHRAGGVPLHRARRSGAASPRSAVDGKGCFRRQS